MDLKEILLGLLVAIQPVLIAFAKTYVQQKTDDMLRRALGDGAARVAGEIIFNNPEVRALGAQFAEAAVASGVQKLRERFPDTVSRFGVSEETLRGMIRGEIGKMGPPPPATMPIPVPVANHPIR